MLAPVTVTVVPPVPPASYLARPRLDDSLRGILRHRLTCVVADTGFGKSSLLGSFAVRANCAWYALAPGDAALPALGRGVALALGSRLHGFRPETASFYRPSGES